MGKITDKLKDFWNRIINKRPALPSGDVKNIENNNFEGMQSSNIIQNFVREDGTQISISPQIDKNGQYHKEKLLLENGTIREVYSYNVDTPELYAEELKKNPQTLSGRKTLYMDVDPSLLQNPYYSEAIVNQLLSADRMQKITNEYRNYVGGLQYDNNGYVTGKFVDQNVINALELRESAQKFAEEQAIQMDRINRMNDPRTLEYGEILANSHMKHTLQEQLDGIKENELEH